MAVALKGQNMGGNPVKEPAVVADNHCAAGKFFQRLFQRAQRVDIKIICRFVKQQQVCAAFQHPRQMHAIALTAGQLANMLLLVPALEVELADISA